MDPETKVCATDSTPLRSCRNAKEAKVRVCISLGETCQEFSVSIS